MRHSRGIDLEPDTRGAYLTVSASAADLSEEQVLGARVAACDFRKWVNRWEIAARFGSQSTLDELRPKLRCSRCGNKRNNGWRLGRIDRDSEWVEVQSLPHRSRI
ncbi:hypothetical protein [Sinorhizobium meliloti]|jgi:hypothetical protein|uniref:hypothetical protein n=1 Tax=Rhizobium meliloti TaxID=382 RepID=UPI0020C08F6B|nr:hypothetical protein [Sinorhizobium meliloti]